MTGFHSSTQIPLPKGWPRSVKSAILHVLSLAQYAAAYTRSWAADSRNARLRLRAQNGQLSQLVALLKEELRIKDGRLRRIPPHKRPHYLPTERMSILELRAARAWSTRHTADVFQVTPATVASWRKRLNEDGFDALVQIRQPVNKFPDFVRYAVQRLKTLCPTLGKVKMADILCRAGLHLGATTVGRILKETPAPRPRERAATTGRVVTAKERNHVWHIDLTAVPIGTGFWSSWAPFALPQRWPFCWWLAVIVDHYSRRAMGFAVFPKRPDSLSIRMFLGRVIAGCNAAPKYVICDRDKIFTCDAFRRWSRRRGIRLRYGAAGQHGSIAVVERFIRTLKDEGLRRVLIPLSRASIAREVRSFYTWYNEHRPHVTLDGKTPNKVYFRLRPASRRPRIEPRKRWPRRAPCARPRTLVAGKPGDRFTLQVALQDGERHLPIVSLNRAA